MPTYASRSLWTSVASGFDAATVAWVAAVFAVDGTVVSTPRKTLVDDLITGLKADGVWSKLDRLWLFAMENSTEALVDIVADSLATANNSPTFTVDEGYTGNGSNTSINANFNPSTAGGNYQQDSACIFGWNNTAGSDVGALFGLNTFTTRVLINLPSFNTNWGVNGSAAAVVDPGVMGLYLANRTASNSQTLDTNGTQLDSSGASSSSVVNSNFFALRATDFSSHQISCVGLGSSLSSGERTAINSRLLTYMNAVGIQTTFDTDTAAWLTAVGSNGGSVSYARALLVDALITGLKDDGVWSKLDRLWLFAMENQDAAQVDLVANAIVTENSSPTFTADQGYTGNGSTSYVDSNFNLAAGGVNYTLDSGSIFAWNNTAYSGGVDMGVLCGNSSITARIYPHYSDNTTYWAIQSSQDGVTTALSGQGLFLMTRTGNTTAVLDFNGSQIHSTTNASSALSAGNLFAFKEVTGTGTYQMPCLGAGGGLSGTDRANLYTHLRTYMTAIGVP